MDEKIYVYNVSGKTLHIKGFCSKSDEIGNEIFKTENDVIKSKGKHFSMCKDCECKKERVLQDYVKKSNQF